MVNTTANGIQLDEETRNQEIVTSLRGFLKHQTERVSLYKEFNDAFKEYTAKRMTPEEYSTICNIVTEGFVELSIEILALEAHLGGPGHSTAMNGSVSSSITQRSSPTTAQDSTATLSPTSSPSAAVNDSNNSSNSNRQAISLNSPEHALLIRQVQLLEKQKLVLTVQGQKWVMEKQAQEDQDQKDREAELQADRVVGHHGEEQDVSLESEVQETAVHDNDSQAQGQRLAGTQVQLNGGVKMSVEEWQTKLDENRDR
ncbi:hypothetical protein EDD21DRAFT_161343 [Dissophora ornata]|nr:hypothetical protein EDD21DRAFT_161343 [Dissophora ornata]